MMGLIAAALFAAPAAAQATGYPHPCGLTLPQMPDPARLAQLTGWQCPARFEAAPDSAQIVRFDLSHDPERAQLLHAISRKADFDGFLFVVQDSDGAQRIARYGFADGRQAYLDRQFSLPLPRITGKTHYVYAIQTGGKETMPLDYLRLERELPGSSQADRLALLIFAFVLGILVVPLMIDAGVFLVLRENFSLFHAAMVGATFVHLLTVSGLNLPFFPLDLPMARMLGVASFGGIIMSASMFVASFIERSCLEAGWRRIFRAHAALVALATVLHASHFLSLGRYPADFFYLACLSGAPFFLVAITRAWRCGSQAARFLALGFAPLIGVGLIRTISHFIPGMPTHDAGALFLLGVVLEVVATTFGVASRFLSLRRDRDHARAEAKVLARQASRDHLTGLANRRALQTGFDTLVADGFHWCALIDLDRFKSINDEYGHGVGDEVLVASAAALEAVADGHAYRLGGEEFLLLLRGPDAASRAEHARQAITRQVASLVEAIDHPVTASMGVIDFSALAAEGSVDFALLYSRVDELLYRAKDGGRNRACREVISFFEPANGACPVPPDENIPLRASA